LQQLLVPVKHVRPDNSLQLGDRRRHLDDGESNTLASNES
jgi:hypothetical protein